MTIKVFISIVLLLTYSLGFAHNVIPHNHASEVGNHENDHQHHHGSNQLNSDHEHISHGDHYEKGWYDLLVCFIHEAHQEDECKNQYYTPANTNRILVKKLQVNKTVAILFSITLETEISELFSDTPINSKTCYLSTSLEDTPLRGPPSNS